jgi:diguanylate cyclase (GGDEF)-like protein/PAS domain S-box-containing protein
VSKAAIDLQVERSGAGDVTGATAVVRDVTATSGARRSQHLAHAAHEALVVADAQFRIQYAAPAVGEMLGYEPAELVAREGARLVHPADHPAVAAAVDRLLADPRRVERLVARLRDRRQRWLWIEGTVSNCLADPDVRGLVAKLRDVTEDVRAQDALRLSGALHQAMVETAEEGIVVAGEDGTARYANPSMARLLGIPAEQLYGADPLVLLGVGGAERPAPTTRRVWRHEVVYQHPSGSERILTVTWSPLSRDVAAGLGALVMVADVTESRRSERALRRRALYDPLTGLPNRYLFRDRLEMAAARQARADGVGTAVLFLDLDGFKPVNDVHGHDAGDELLRQVGGRLSGAVRATDTVGRHGGDEFVILCEDIDEAAALAVATRIHSALRCPFELPCGLVEIGASIGIALSPSYAVEELIEQADVAMYAAKRDGVGGSTVARS